MTTIKPQLADDANLDTLPYPVWVMPKIDGVRGMTTHGQLTGRSLDPFKGFGVTELFSSPLIQNCDGELTLGSDPKAERLCSLTTGAVSRFKDVTEAPDLHWWLFDYLSPAALDLDYEGRYGMLEVTHHDFDSHRVHLVPYRVAENKAEALALYEHFLDLGYEGAIYRNPRAKVKPGRPNSDLQQFMRSKPWQDDEMLVTGITQGEKNNNEKTTNTLGKSERSSAKAGKVPNGEVGSIQGVTLKDICSNVTGKLLFPKGHPITVSSGTLTVKEAKHFWLHPEELVGHIVKFQHLAHGVKDMPRMGAYLSHRLAEDMSDA